VSIEARCQELFRTHRAEEFGGTFHVAHRTAYRSLRSWDSGYHALALRHIEPELAISELRTLYHAGQLDDGLVVHERPLPGTEEQVKERARQYGPLFRDDGRSWLIDPPVAAYAAARIVADVGPPARDLLERATSQLDGIWAERLPPDTNLPVILHPFESGTDASPLFDAVVDGTSHEEWRDEIATLTRSAVACRFEPDLALRSGHAFVVEDPVFCGWFLLALQEAVRAWELMGDTPAATRMRIRAEMISEAILERLWWEEEEIFAGFDRRREEPLRDVTAGGLLPAASRSLLEEGTAKRVVERYLRPSGSPLWGPKGISFNPVDPHAAPVDEVLPWRGNIMLGATQYWGHLALVRAQRPADARVARSQLEERIEEQGFREFYDAVTGVGRGAGETDGFTWPALVLEMRVSESG
jgi:hypothetical protein